MEIDMYSFYVVFKIFLKIVINESIISLLIVMWDVGWFEY